MASSAYSKRTSAYACDCETKPDIYLDVLTGDSVCRKCGIAVYHHMIDRGPDWRAYTPGEQRRAHAEPLPKTGSSLPYVPGLGGTHVNQDFIRSVRRLARHEGNSKHRSYKKGVNLIERLGGQLDLFENKNVMESGYAWFKYAEDNDLVRGRSIEAVVAASFFLSCKENKVCVGMETISEKTCLPFREVSRAYAMLRSDSDGHTVPYTPREYLPSIAGTLESSHEVAATADRILESAERKKIHMGKDPEGVAGAAVYIAYRIHHESAAQKKVAKAAHVTEVTLRNRYKELVKMLGLDIR